MATLQGVFASTLRAGAVTTAECLLPPLPVTFANQNPKVKAKLQVGNRDEIVRTLAGGSEMSSNEAVKEMCAPGFGVAILSLHTCVLRVGHMGRPAKNAGARAVARTEERAPRRVLSRHVSPCVARQAFLAYALHQPLLATCLPANNWHGAIASAGLPW